MFSSSLLLLETMTHIDSYWLCTLLDFNCGSCFVFVELINYNLSRGSLNTMNNMQIHILSISRSFSRLWFLKIKIQKRLNRNSIEKDDPIAVNWTTGQTCLAKYDEKLCRGTVQIVNRSKCICRIEFRFGNSVDCHVWGRSVRETRLKKKWKHKTDHATQSL